MDCRQIIAKRIVLFFHFLFNFSIKHFHHFHFIFPKISCNYDRFIKCSLIINIPTSFYIFSLVYLIFLPDHDHIVVAIANEQHCNANGKTWRAAKLKQHFLQKSEWFRQRERKVILSRVFKKNYFYYFCYILLHFCN